MQNGFDRGTQELKILASVIVYRLQWLMHVESYYSKNARLQEVDKQFNLCASWSLQETEMAFEPLCSRKDADKELLING